MRAHARRASRLLARAPIDLSRVVSSTRASSSRATERRIDAKVSTFILFSGLGLVGLLGAREATETHGSILDPERDACASDSDGDRARRARRWCERAGGTFSSCELGAAAARDEAARDASRDGRGGVGAFARGVGGTLMTIPDAATMNARSCAGDPALGETYVELARRGALDARMATMCMLMIERRRGGVERALRARVRTRIGSTDARCRGKVYADRVIERIRDRAGRRARGDASRGRARRALAGDASSIADASRRYMRLPRHLLQPIQYVLIPYPTLNTLVHHYS